AAGSPGPGGRTGAGSGGASRRAPPPPRSRTRAPGRPGGASWASEGSARDPAVAVRAEGRAPATGTRGRASARGGLGEPGPRVLLGQRRAQVLDGPAGLALHVCGDDDLDGDVEVTGGLLGHQALAAHPQGTSGG